MGILVISEDIYKRARHFCDETDQRLRTFVETAIEEFLHVETLTEKLFRACEKTNKSGKSSYNIKAHEKILAEILEGKESDPYGHKRIYHQSRINRHYFGGFE